MESGKKKRIGERLATVRASFKMSQKEMGELLGISWRTYQNYEVGSREVSVEFVMQFCAQFEIKPEWLIDGAGNKSSIDEVQLYKKLLSEVQSSAQSKDINLDLDALVDISDRLFRRVREGNSPTARDIADYIDLKIGN